MSLTTSVQEIVGKNRMSSADLPEKYWELIERYRAELMNQALAILGNAEDAEDVVQETFSEAFRHRDKLAHAQSLSAWLRSINKSNAVDRQRARGGESNKRERKQRELPERMVTTGGFSLLDVRDSVARAIEKLSPPLRDVIVMHYWEHLHYDEIAHRLGIAPITVRRRLYDASLELYSRLKGNFQIDPHNLPRSAEPQSNAGSEHAQEDLQ
jgi:RNA polymerase sigma-70 factor, ECF subfamily